MQHPSGAGGAGNAEDDRGAAMGFREGKSVRVYSTLLLLAAVACSALASWQVMRRSGAFRQQAGEMNIRQAGAAKALLSPAFAALLPAIGLACVAKEFLIRDRYRTLLLNGIGLMAVMMLFLAWRTVAVQPLLRSLQERGSQIQIDERTEQ